MWRQRILCAVRVLDEQTNTVCARVNALAMSKQTDIKTFSLDEMRFALNYDDKMEDIHVWQFPNANCVRIDFDLTLIDDFAECRRQHTHTHHNLLLLILYKESTHSQIIGIGGRDFCDVGHWSITFGFRSLSDRFLLFWFLSLTASMHCVETPDSW